MTEKRPRRHRRASSREPVITRLSYHATMAAMGYADGSHRLFGSIGSIDAFLPGLRTLGLWLTCPLEASHV